MDKSIFQLINLILRKIPCVSEYQGADTRMCATMEHIGQSLVYALLIILVSVLTPWVLIAYPVVWALFAPFKEFYLDRAKNKGRPVGDVWAQVFERTIGFVLCLPLMIGVSI